MQRHQFRYVSSICSTSSNLDAVIKSYTTSTRLYQNKYRNICAFVHIKLLAITENSTQLPGLWMSNPHNDILRTQWPQWTHTAPGFSLLCITELPPGWYISNKFSKSTTWGALFVLTEKRFRFVVVSKNMMCLESIMGIFVLRKHFNPTLKPRPSWNAIGLFVLLYIYLCRDRQESAVGQVQTWDNLLNLNDSCRVRVRIAWHQLSSGLSVCFSEFWVIMNLTTNAVFNAVFVRIRKCFFYGEQTTCLKVPFIFSTDSVRWLTGGARLDWMGSPDWIMVTKDEQLSEFKVKGRSLCTSECKMKS